jgi:hypothetical protein
MAKGFVTTVARLVSPEPGHGMGAEQELFAAVWLDVAVLGRVR